MNVPCDHVDPSAVSLTTWYEAGDPAGPRWNQTHGSNQAPRWCTGEPVSLTALAEEQKRTGEQYRPERHSDW